MIAGQPERIRVPRVELDRAQGKSVPDGAAWALVEARMGAIAAERATGTDIAHVDWSRLLGPLDRTASDDRGDHDKDD